jgi:AcrR family transcriptional regulator
MKKNKRKGRSARPFRPGRRRKTVRPNRRSTATINKILSVALHMLLDRGTAKMSLSGVCLDAGVSRGTLYRYFSSKEELLSAVTAHIRAKAGQKLEAATQGHTEPLDRLKAVVGFLNHYLDTAQLRRLLEVEPSFALDYLRKAVPEFITGLLKVLNPTFDYWDEILDTKLDRWFLTELMVRHTLGDLVVPSAQERRQVLSQISGLVDLVRGRK